MQDGLERIRLNARYISAGTSLADNETVKIHNLEILRQSIYEITSGIELSDSQKMSLDLVLKSISELTNLSGKSFRNQCVGLTGQVEILIEKLKNDS